MSSNAILVHLLVIYIPPCRCHICRVSNNKEEVPKIEDLYNFLSFFDCGPPLKAQQSLAQALADLVDLPPTAVGILIGRLLAHPTSLGAVFGRLSSPSPLLLFARPGVNTSLTIYNIPLKVHSFFLKVHFCPMSG